MQLPDLRVYALGLRGFLLSHYRDTFIDASDGYCVKDLPYTEGIFVDFGCKCLDDFNYSLKCALDNTCVIHDLCLKHKMRYTFASSYAVFAPKNTYGFIKAWQEKVVVSVPKHTILRIPAVYDRTRKAGLMAYLKTHEVYADKVLDFCTLDCFHEQFEMLYNRSGIHTLRTNRRMLITEIKKEMCDEEAGL